MGLQVTLSPHITACIGRDTAPRSAAIYAKELLKFIEKEKFGELGKSLNYCTLRYGPFY